MQIFLKCISRFGSVNIMSNNSISHNTTSTSTLQAIFMRDSQYKSLKLSKSLLSAFCQLKYLLTMEIILLDFMHLRKDVLFRCLLIYSYFCLQFHFFTLILTSHCLQQLETRKSNSENDLVGILKEGIVRKEGKIKSTRK